MSGARAPSPAAARHPHPRAGEGLREGGPAEAYLREEAQ